MSVSTNSIVWLIAGSIFRIGYLENIFSNHLGQTCYLVDGQIYSDPAIWCRYYAGQTAILDLWNDKTQDFDRRLSRILEIHPNQVSDSFELTVQFWMSDCQQWSQPITVPGKNIVLVPDKEPVPKESSLTIKSNS
jgi:hypothetical protein